MEDIFTGVGGNHKTQGDYITASADIFSVVPRDKSTHYGRESVHRPTTENVDGPYEFYLPAEGSTYIDPDGFRMSGYTQLKMIGANGALEDLKETVKANAGVNPPIVGVDAPHVAPISFAPGMAFQTKEVSMQGQLINYATQPLENISAYIENLLSYGTDAKNSVLEGSAQWYPDEPGKADKCDGPAFLKRKKLWAGSKLVPFCIPLQIGVFNTERFFPDGLDIHIRFTKAPDAMLYTTTETNAQFKLVLSQLKIHSRRVTMSADILRDHARLFNAGGHAIYPYSRTDMKFVNIAKHSSTAWADSIHRNRVPTGMMIFFIDASALAGNAQKNVQNLQHFNVSNFKCLINSEEVPPHGYRQNYEGDDFALTYRRFFDNSGIRTNNIGNGITASAFKNGSCIYVIDNTPDQCNGFHDHTDIAGKVEYQVTFQPPLTEAVSMVILSAYDDAIRLDKYRNVVNRGEPLPIGR